MIDEVEAAISRPSERSDAEWAAEGRRKVCLQTAVQLLREHLLLAYEVCDYAKYLNDYLVDGSIPREEDLPAPLAAGPKARNKDRST